MDLKFIVPFGLIIFMSSWQWTHGEHNIELNSFTPSTDYDTTWVEWKSLRMKKVSRNKFTAIGDFSINMNMNDEQKISLQVFKIDPATKKQGPLVFNMNKPVCQFIAEEDIYKDMMKYSNLPASDQCPFVKGDYNFDNFQFETNFLPENAPKGEYVIVVTFKNAELNVAACEVEITVN